MFGPNNGFNNGMGFINNINCNPMMNMNNQNKFNCNPFYPPNNQFFNNNQNYPQNHINVQNFPNQNQNNIYQKLLFKRYNDNNMNNMNNQYNNLFQQPIPMVTGGNQMSFISPLDIANIQIKGIIKNNNYTCPNPYNYPIRNIIFCYQDGNMTTVKAPTNMKICDLFKFLMNSLGISERVLEKKLFFFFNGRRLSPHEQRTVEQLLTNISKITVMDSQEVVGA